MTRFVVVALLICAGCATERRKAAIPAATPRPVDNDAFLNLRDGYRLRVVTPITKSGAFLVKTSPAPAPVQGKGNQLEVTLQLDDDFLGYETSYYLVMEDKRGFSIRFNSAERIIDGKTTAATTGIKPLFEMPRGIRNARLMFLIRQSESDHDMAFVGARTNEALELLTESVRADAAACRAERRLYCAWIPAGIAVRAEVQDFRGEWQPVK